MIKFKKYHSIYFLLSQRYAVQSLKRITCDERGKIGRKNLTTFCIKSLAIWGGHLLAVFRVRTLQRITCVEKENKPSSLMAIMKEERKEEKLKSRGKNLRVPRPCPSIIQWRMVLVTGKICDDVFETLMCISNAHTTKFREWYSEGCKSNTCMFITLMFRSKVYTAKFLSEYNTVKDEPCNRTLASLCRALLGHQGNYSKHLLCSSAARSSSPSGWSRNF